MVYYIIEGYLSRNVPPCWEKEEVEGEASWKEPCDGTPMEQNGAEEQRTARDDDLLSSDIGLRPGLPTPAGRSRVQVSGGELPSAYEKRQHCYVECSTAVGSEPNQRNCPCCLWS
ncbi:hypothetical protein EYF80_039735 [Liparis tanakae]|uniref:Uncharacterized protein n=1 Tax=Liparis tanakae TaxID=230148 RepID=A0A4Z2G931_9TELE|nr:hypothetical protein EYF80_039735 [Liparis tanakae]